MLDVFELCTPELQEKMLPMRTKFKEDEDKKLEMQQQPKASALWRRAEHFVLFEKPSNILFFIQ